MIGAQFIFRVVQFLLYFVLGGGLLLALVFVLNRAIRFVGDLLDIETEDFFRWIVRKYNGK
jgi:hypothetical protein